MDGSAVIASTIVRTNLENAPRTSLRYTAQVSPKGTVTASAMAICSSVPTTACRIPPCVSGSSGPAVAMSWVKKFRWRNASMPRIIGYATIVTRASSAKTARLCTTAETSRSRTVSAFSVSETSSP